MESLTKEQISALFTKKEQKTLKFPKLEEINWENLDYLGWIHPSGHLGYIVYKLNGKCIGLCLDITKNNNNKAGMCSICKSLHENTKLALFSRHTKSDKNKIVGDFICSDLQCSLYVRGLIFNPLVQMWEHITKEDKIERLKLGLEDFMGKIVN